MSSTPTTIHRPTGPPAPPDPKRPRRTVAAAMVSALLLLLMLGLLASTGARLRGDTEAPPEPPALPDRPALANAGADPEWTGLVTSMVEFSNDLRTRPDPARLGDYLHPSNPTYGEALQAQLMLADGTWRYDPTPEPLEVTTVEVLGRDGARAFVLVRYASTPRYRVVDKTGTVVADTPAAPGSEVVWRLEQVGNRWLLADSGAVR